MAKPLTPEGAALKEITDYLNLCRLGKVTRASVGMARMGEKSSNHPWAKDTRRIVKFGEVGESDLRMELTGDTRTVYVEVKKPGWNPPTIPKAGAAVSTVKKFRHHQEQVQFQARQIARGHIAFFARSAFEVHAHLLEAGFLGLPCPQETRKAPAAPSARAKASKAAMQPHRRTP